MAIFFFRRTHSPRHTEKQINTNKNKIKKKPSTESISCAVAFPYCCCLKRFACFAVPSINLLTTPPLTADSFLLFEAASATGKKQHPRAGQTRLFDFLSRPALCVLHAATHTYGLCGKQAYTEGPGQQTIVDAQLSSSLARLRLCSVTVGEFIKEELCVCVWPASFYNFF